MCIPLYLFFIWVKVTIVLLRLEGLVCVNSFRVKDLEGYLNGLNKIFDFVRIVNPISKEIIHQKGEEVDIIHSPDCYEFWDSGRPCNNCISAKAQKEKKTMTKIGENDHGVFMVMATPITFGDDFYIVEMLQDITETMFKTVSDVKDTMRNNDNIIAELSERVITDELTGAYNRRFINEELPSCIVYENEDGEKISIIMLDIDCFKEINDTYGHVAGDFVLKNLVNIINSKIRKNYDWVARYGGDEFLIFLKNSNNKVANNVVEQIQIALKNEILRFQDKSANITISFGIYTAESNTKTFGEILQIVDNNLMKAKQGGKNMAISS